MRRERQLWAAVALATLAGLALRIANARGALWLDEAWSAASAVDAGTPLGVFLHINHDNNHHLNSLWLQFVGEGAAPLVQRALAIVSGTAAIPLAAAIARRAGTVAALAAAGLFALSPVLVVYGAEARGYAPMLLALLAIVALVAQWLEAPERRLPIVPVALLVLVGLLAQLTLVFALAGVAAWIAVQLLARLPFRLAVSRAIAPAMALAGGGIAGLALTFGIAASAGGMAFGNRDAFALAGWAEGVGLLLRWTAGGQAALAALAALALAVRWHPDVRGRRLAQGAALLVLVPIVVAPLLQLQNAGMPRYYLTSAAGLMLAAAIGADALARRAGWRWAVVVAAVALPAAALASDATLIRDRRADPGRALAEIARRAPAGAAVALDNARASAVIRAAAASARYPLAVAEAECPPAPFLFVDRDGDQRFPVQPTRCGARYGAIAEGHPQGLSGTHWRLYERLP